MLSIDQAVQDTEQQHETLKEAAPRPYVLDDYTVGRVIEVYSVQLDDLWLYEEQLARWKKTPVTVAEYREVERLERQVERLRAALTAILTLAEELKKGTIEQVLGKSDAQVGLGFLLGRKPREA